MKPLNIMLYFTLVFNISILTKYHPKIINYNFHNEETNSTKDDFALIETKIRFINHLFFFK